MKKIILTIITIVLGSSTFAQTNTFPTSGNVGIGTLSPNDILHIHKTAANTRLRVGNNSGYDQLLYFNGSADWSMGIDYSNSNAFSIASTSSLDNSHRLTILSDGKVGIGRTNPSYTLHVAGDIRASGTLSVEKSGNYRVSLNGQSSGYIVATNDSNQAKFVIHTNGSSYFNGGNVGIGTASPGARLHLENTAGTNSEWIRLTEGATEYRISNEGGRLKFREGTNDRFVIRSGGNIGIGTTSPVAKLEVKGDFIRLQESAAARTLDIYPAVSGQNHRFTSTTTSGGYNFENNAGTLMTISSTGQVGIGTTSPGEKLEVNGTIRSKRVKVEATGWPDYVFSKNYTLNTLEEVEDFIQKNQHLPEVPSAKEIEEKGLDLGAMDATLLKKVEELTLYLIEEHKSSKLQATSLKNLKEENSELKKENQELKALFLELRKEIDQLKKK